MKYSVQEIINNGEIINQCLIDVNEFDEIQSNGSQEIIYKYKGHVFAVWMDLNNQPLDDLNKKISPSEYNYNE